MNLRQLDLNLLVVLDRLLQDRNLAQTAKRLGVTQPAISMSLAKLRSHFGDDLFIRTPRGMQPTALALRLREPVQRIMDTVLNELMPGMGFDPSQGRRVFHIAMSDAGELAFMPKLWTYLRDHNSGITLRSVPYEKGTLESGLESGAIDLALGYFSELKAANIYQQALYESPVYALVRQDHPEVRDELTVEHLGKYSMALIERGPDIAEVVQRAGQLLQHPLPMPWRLAHFAGLPNLLLASDLIGIVPKAIASSYSSVAPLKMLPLPFESTKIRVCQYWHGLFRKDPALIWLRGLVVQLFALESEPVVKAPLVERASVVKLAAVQSAAAAKKGSK